MGDELIGADSEDGRGEADAPGGRPPSGMAAGTAYLVHPDDGPGPGVLVLSSWRGLNGATKAVADSLADAGFTALAPDLFGSVPADDAAGQALLAEMDPDGAAAMVLSSVVALRSQCADPAAPVGVVGFSSGGSLALWLATRNPESIAAAVTYYGVQDIDFTMLNAPVLGHFAEFDDLCSTDDRVEMQSHLLLLEKRVEVHEYPGTWHFFAEETDINSPAADAAALAWTRTIGFLSTHLDPDGA
ncbi:MAG: dienelactone hydrolase family protein [Microthrixaceae bacterium]